MLPRGFILCYFFSGALFLSIQNEKKIVTLIDQDGGADDAMAVFMALLYEKYNGGPRVIALTTTHGNIGENQTFVNTQRILNVINMRGVSIYRGASKPLLYDPVESDYYFGRDGLGNLPYEHFRPIKSRNEVAAVAMVNLAKKYQGRLNILSLGSLTNIALAIRLDPRFLSRLNQLYVAGGHIFDEKKYPKPEFNIMMDPESYWIVMDAATLDKVTLIPFSVALDNLDISKDWRVNVLGSIKTSLMKTFNQWERVALATSPSWCMLDPCAMAAILVDSVVTEYGLAESGVKLAGEERGICTYNFSSATPNTRVVKSMNRESYKTLLLELFSAELKTIMTKDI